jgi:hypothetical protein
LRHTLGYLKGTLHYGITYQQDGDLRPFGYVDTDYTGNVDSSQSTEGHIFFVVGGLVSWASKRQETVALLTVEAEYIAFTWASQQALWLSKFMDEVALGQEQLVNILSLWTTMVRLQTPRTTKTTVEQNIFASNITSSKSVLQQAISLSLMCLQMRILRTFLQNLSQGMQ